MTEVYVSHVNLTLTSTPDSGQCTMTIKGAFGAQYANSTGRLKLSAVSSSGHKLVTTSVSGCLGVWQVGDISQLIETYKLSTADGTIKLVSR